MCFASGPTMSLSAPGMSWSISSTTVILEPSSAYTVAISRPMIPPPRTSRRSGTSAISSAEVESSTRGSSWGTNGRRTGSEPAATMTWSKPTTVVAPSGAVTSRRCGERNRPDPCTVETFRCLARPFSPPVSRSTTPSFHVRSSSRSISGAPNFTPCPLISLVSAMTLAACSSAFDGMQPTLRQTPPRVSRASTTRTSSPRSAARNAAV